MNSKALPTTMFDARRRQYLNQHPKTGGVVYIMAREQRVADNWALIAAYEAAHERNVPLYVVFPLAPMFSHGSARHNEWMVSGLKEVEADLTALNIPFVVIYGPWAESIPQWCHTHDVGEVIFDFNPLQPVRDWRSAVAETLTISVSMVDARNIVPCFVASPKAEFAAYTFRPKVTKLLPDFLTEFPTLVPMKKTHAVTPIDWELVRDYRQCDYSVPVPSRLMGGSRAAARVLRDFVDNRLTGYDTGRNDPNLQAVSDLSPYLRWGNISAARVALTVQTSHAPGDDKRAFLEELIVRRELSDNFCYYTPNHLSTASIHPWAKATIAEHRHDTREHIYTYEEFRDGKTHDDLWNAAQLQMVTEGKMHGFMRMYWAKKIMEWTPDVATAYEYALTLNDTYELDGRDSNGVVGVLWSIGGVHDRAWNERPVFGKIRYMNYAGCKRKFDVKAYVRRYSGHSESSLFL